MLKYLSLPPTPREYARVWVPIEVSLGCLSSRLIQLVLEKKAPLGLAG